MSRRLVGLAAAVACVAAAPASAQVLSLDQCADQYVLALVPRERIVGLSHRADDPDSHLREAARGLPRVRASAEAVLARKPRVVVRYWGGDARLERTLASRGVRVARIEDATDFDGVRRNVRTVAAALGESARGEALIARMDADLAAARGAWGGRRALYLTPGGWTAGRGTLPGAVLEAAGLTPVAGPGFAAAPLERLALDPPDILVLGFFEDGGVARWSPGRHPVVRRLAAERPTVSLPGSLLGCPAWFAAEAAARLARAAPR